MNRGHESRPDQGRASIGHGHGCTHVHSKFFAKESKLVGKIHGQILMQIAHVRGFGCSISHSRKAREGKGRTYLVARRSVRRRTGKGGATPLSSARRRLEREREERESDSVT